MFLQSTRRPWRDDDRDDGDELGRLALTNGGHDCAPRGLVRSTRLPHLRLGVPELQHSRNILRMTTFRPTECLIGFFCYRMPRRKKRYTFVAATSCVNAATTKFTESRLSCATEYCGSECKRLACEMWDRDLRYNQS
jgi:hypothetical protein